MSNFADVFDPKVLEAAFAEARKIYKERGFNRRLGYGDKLAIITVDMANAWTRPGHPFSCDADSAVAATARLLQAARNCKQKIYCFHSTTTFNENGYEDCGLWQHKIPLTTLIHGTEWEQIDSRLEVPPNETVFVKKYASCFAGTPLNYQLNSLGVDTIIVTGATAGGCVRHTVMDGGALGYRVIVPEETIADRIPGVICWNLFDMDTKFADVEKVEDVIAHINSLK
jgi:nicotinamidase-related amidase